MSRLKAERAAVRDHRRMVYALKHSRYLGCASLRQLGRAHMACESTEKVTGKRVELSGRVRRLPRAGWKRVA